MANKQHLFFRAASEAIADSPLHKLDEVGIAGKDPVQEPPPCGARRVGVIGNLSVMRQQVMAVWGRRVPVVSLR